MKTIKLLIKIQSASDIITNSSSEVFLCRNNTEMTMEELIDFIEQYHEACQVKDWEAFQKMSPQEQEQYDYSGGMGGFFEITTYKDAGDSWYKGEFDNLDDPENYLLVDTDWCHKATIKWLQENLDAQYLE